jgi:ADP-ribose pyrophosphatase
MIEKVENWEELSCENVFSNKYGRGIEKKVFRLPDGKECEFFLNSGNDSVFCLAMTKDKKVILVKQFRPGPAKILLGMPGGGVNSGEDIKIAIERELLEETGYKGKPKFVETVFPGAYAMYKKNFFIVNECEKITEPKSEDNGEVLELILLSLDEFRAHIKTGQMTDIGGAYLCLDQLGLL